MMKNFSLKQSFFCARAEFIKWICDARMIILGVLLIFIYSFAIEPLKSNAELMGEPLNILEPFIAIANSGAILLIIPLVFLTLIADFPKIDTNTVFYIMRVGRLNWLFGQLLKLIFMALSYLAVIFLGAVLPMLSDGFWYNGWSNVATKFSSRFPASETPHLDVQTVARVPKYAPALLRVPTSWQFLPFRDWIKGSTVMFDSTFLKTAF